METRLQFPAKEIRAQIIKRHVEAGDYAGVVCFSCGHAAEALRAVGLDVLEIGDFGTLRANKWWTLAEIHRIWPRRFDATSGHLPMPLMASVARAFYAHLGELTAECYEVPTGSGETILALRMAYPFISFRPVYNMGPGTDYNGLAPLNGAVLGDITLKGAE